jgi:2-dehydropantoate 2-reductase
MRFVCYGAGAIGGVIGARLAQSGHDVVLIARGAHGEAIRTRGLTIVSPADTATLSIPCVSHPSELQFQYGDVVILGMKTQDTIGALDDLQAAAGSAIPVICAQNGVESERLAIRRFANVYATPVRLPATHLEPGIVQADSSPTTGVLDIGRYPRGADSLCVDVAAALEASTFSSRPEADVMRHKYTKLLRMNLVNAIDVIAGMAGREAAGILRAAQAEARACFEAAEIVYASDDEDRQRRGDLIRVQPIAGRQRSGSSTWQSLARGKQVLEVDYLNGEIVFLGRLHGIPTPVNATLQRLANQAAREGRRPGSTSVAQLEAEVAAAAAAVVA